MPRRWLRRGQQSSTKHLLTRFQLALKLGWVREGRQDSINARLRGGYEMLRQSRLLLAVLLSLPPFVTVTATVLGARINAKAAGPPGRHRPPDGGRLCVSRKENQSTT